MNTYKDSLPTKQEDIAFEEFWEDLHSPPSDEELEEMHIRLVKQIADRDHYIKRKILPYEDNPGSLNEPDKIIPSDLW